MKTKVLMIAVLAFMVSTSKAETFTKVLLKQTQASVLFKSQAQFDSSLIGNITASDGNYYEVFSSGGDSGNIWYVVQTYGDENPITGDAIYVDSGTFFGAYADSLVFYNPAAPTVQVTFTGYCWF